VADGARVLVVDDEWVNVRLLEKMLDHAGYRHVRSVTDSSAVLGAVAEFCPDLILLDFHMPAPDGLALLHQLGPWIEPPGMVPVIMLSGDVSSRPRLEALQRGARDFVTKPFEIGEVLLRMHNVLENRQLQLQIQAQNERLQRTVNARLLDLEEAQFELVERLALAAELRDDDTYEHALRVGRTSALLAERLGFDSEAVALIRRAAPLHDVGKIGITDAIFRKPGPLSPDEWIAMKQHVQLGINILADSASEVLRMAEEIVRSHHERWDGTGYPHGLCCEEIPFVGRIVAVADVFDALSHARPYKAAWPLEDAVLEIGRGAGAHFDPWVVDAFMELDHPYLLAPIEAARPPELVAARACHRTDLGSEI
jgi:putative two-component system response regulator